MNRQAADAASEQQEDHAVAGNEATGCEAQHVTSNRPLTVSELSAASGALESASHPSVAMLAAMGNQRHDSASMMMQQQQQGGSGDNEGLMASYLQLKRQQEHLQQQQAMLRSMRQKNQLMMSTVSQLSGAGGAFGAGSSHADLMMQQQQQMQRQSMMSSMVDNYGTSNFMDPSMSGMGGSGSVMSSSMLGGGGNFPSSSNPLWQQQLDQHTSSGNMEGSMMMNNMMVMNQTQSFNMNNNGLMASAMMNEPIAPMSGGGFAHGGGMFADQGIQQGNWGTDMMSSNLHQRRLGDSMGAAIGGDGHLKMQASNKPREKPKRPLSAYNIFFKEERHRILDQIPDSEAKLNPPKRKRKKKPHGKIGFETLAKRIGQRWKSLPADEMAVYKRKAADDMKRYKREMENYVSQDRNIIESKIDDATIGMSNATSHQGLSFQNFLQESNKKQRLGPNIFRLDDSGHERSDTPEK